MDNGCGAVARMILSAPASVPLPQVLPVWLKCLPIKDDFQEADPVACALVLLLDAPESGLAAYVDQVAYILLACLCVEEPNQVPDATRAATATKLKALPATATQAAFAKLSPEQQAKAQALLA